MEAARLQRRVRIWDAINAYADACGGDTSAATVSDARMSAVVSIEGVLESDWDGPGGSLPGDPELLNELDARDDDCDRCDHGVVCRCGGPGGICHCAELCDCAQGRTLALRRHHG